jgi:hypothetical protein
MLSAMAFTAAKIDRKPDRRPDSIGGCGQLAIATTLEITGFLAQRWHLSILVQNLATMLGLGLGIDYALLMISRFREAIAAGNDGPTAGVIAAHHLQAVSNKAPFRMKESRNCDFDSRYRNRSMTKYWRSS